LAFLWESRSTWLAELQGALLPHQTILAREFDDKALNEFFIPEDEKGDLTWRRNFLTSEERDGVADLVETMKAWARGNQPEGVKPGLTVLRGTSFSWLSIPSNSFKREFTRLAKAAIVEERRWATYRKEIVTASPIAHFRHQIETRLGPFAKKTYLKGKPVFVWNFSDGLVPADLSEIRGILDMTFKDRLRTVAAQNDAVEYHGEINEIIRFVEKRRVASVDGVVGRQIESNVHFAFEKFIEVGFN